MSTEEKSGRASRVQKTTVNAAEAQELKRRQRQLEDSIVSYQRAIIGGNNNTVNQSYERVCRLYQPLAFIQKWFQYRYLYDSREDFIQDYLGIFCTALAAWKPRDLRPESRYGGSGDFKNYFWSCLSNRYTNMVKADSSGKRNLSSKCPICDIWCNPLSTHLLNHHSDLLWDQIARFGYELDTLTHCPFCISYKIPKTVVCEHDTPCVSCLQNAVRESLKRHMLSKHSTFLFDRFQELFPQHVTISSRPMSVYYANDDDDDETNLYDNTCATDGLEQLMAHTHSPNA